MGSRVYQEGGEMGKESANWPLPPGSVYPPAGKWAGAM